MVNTGSDESDSDENDTGTGIWKKAPRPKSILRGPVLTVQTDSNGLKSRDLHATFASGSTPASQHRPRSLSPSAVPAQPAKSRVSKAFTASEEDTWAPRPPPEDVYERLEDFFPEHDLDKPVIEMISGGTSPTGTSSDLTLAPAPPTPAPTDKARVRGKKSIRLVAQERKRYIDRTSRIGGDAFTAIQRKRSTKLWGSRVEEVDTSNLPESPSTSEGASACCVLFSFECELTIYCSDVQVGARRAHRAGDVWAGVLGAQRDDGRDDRRQAG
jgi:mitogen-activated protein kinase kinase kinase